VQELPYWLRVAPAPIHDLPFKFAITCYLYKHVTDMNSAPKPIIGAKPAVQPMAVQAAATADFSSETEAKRGAFHWSVSGRRGNFGGVILI
jgi:hypothetical protein